MAIQPHLHRVQWTSWCSSHVDRCCDCVLTGEWQSSWIPHDSTILWVGFLIAFSKILKFVLVPKWMAFNLPKTVLEEAPFQLPGPVIGRLGATTASSAGEPKTWTRNDRAVANLNQLTAVDTSVFLEDIKKHVKKKIWRNNLGHWTTTGLGSWQVCGWWPAPRCGVAGRQSLLKGKQILLCKRIPLTS